MLDFNKHDFSWLREWRIRAKEIELDYDNCIAIQATKSDISDMRDTF